MNLINLITTTAQSVAANTPIPLTTISRRTGCACQFGVNGVFINKPGYYLVTGTVTFEGTATGTATLEVAKNGAQVPGAEASTTTADGSIYTLPINTIVRVYCNEQATITIQNTGAAIDMTNATLSVVAL